MKTLILTDFSIIAGKMVCGMRIGKELSTRVPWFFKDFLEFFFFIVQRLPKLIQTVDSATQKQKSFGFFDHCVLYQA